MKESLQQHIPFDVDISEDALLRKYPLAFKTLLLDQTKSMGGKQHNIFWATHDYESLGEGYEYNSPIQIDFITKEHGMVIMPRVLKDKKTQRERSKNKAEIFTPAWICNAQNNLVDGAWFDRKDTFNHENDNKTWTTVEGKIEFLRTKGKTWCDYIRRTCLEITCGEAPYLASRYDATTGKPIPMKDRIGLLDRKLRVVKEHTKNTRQWLYWAYEAFQNIYGFEWQGDSLLLARENMLMTFIEYYHDKFDEYPKTNSINKVANIISWNLWQMDGLKGVIPNSCKNKVSGENLFKEKVKCTCPGCKTGNIKLHNGIKCYIMNWKTKVPTRFIDLMKKKD